MDKDDADRLKQQAEDVVEKAEELHDKAADKLRPVAKHPAFQAAAKAGFVVTGLIYVLIGWTAIRMASGLPEGEKADQTGALQFIEQTVPGGFVALLVAAIACLALALWFVVDGIRESGGKEDRRERLTVLLTGVAKAGFYAFLGSSALDVLFDDEEDAEQVADEASDVLMQSWPGTVLLVAAGLGIAIFGVVLSVRGIRRTWVKDHDLSMTGEFRPVVRAIAIIGYVSRGIAILLIGSTFIAAVLTRTPETAAGMSGALGTVLALPFGAQMLVLIGIGLIIGGVATATRAVTQRMEQPRAL